MSGDTTASAVFRQLRAVPADHVQHSAQLQLVQQLVQGNLELHLPRKARARALLEWASGRCAAKDGPSTPSAIQDPQYWHLFAEILTLKDDAPSSSSSSKSSSIVPDLLSKSDIRQIVFLSRGVPLLNALRTCLEVIPTQLNTAEGSTSTAASGVSESSIAAQALLDNLYRVFSILFPLALSSPTTTLDGLLPILHSYIRSSSSFASTSTSTSSSTSSPILASWIKLGHLLLDTFKSLCKVSNTSNGLTPTEKIQLKKVASSFLDHNAGYANWKSFTKSYVNILHALEHSSTYKGKGKQREGGMEVDAHVEGVTPAMSANSITTSPASDDPKALLAILNGFISTAVLSPANLSRYFSSSLSGGGSAMLDSPTQAQESLSEIFNALKAIMQDLSSTDAVSMLPKLFLTYIETLSTHSHDLFAPARRNRSLTDGVNATVGANSTSSRSAVEYQVQTCFRNAVFGYVQGSVQLLKVASATASTTNSPRKRGREDEGVTQSTDNTAARMTISKAIRLILQQVREKNVYITGGADANKEWLRILSGTARFIVDELLLPSAGAVSGDGKTAAAAMQAVTHIVQMDYMALEECLPSLLRAIASISTTSETAAPFNKACGELLDSALSYNGKIRQLPSFLTTVQATLSSFIDETAASKTEGAAAVQDSFEQVMDTTFKSPLLSRSFLVRITKECKTSLGAAQFTPLVKQLLSNLEDYLSEASSNEAAVDESMVASQQPAKKKKGRKFQITSEPITVQAASWKVLAISQLLQAILLSTTSEAIACSNTTDVAELEAVLTSLNASSTSSVSESLSTVAISAGIAQQRLSTAMLQLQSVWHVFQERPGQLAGLESVPQLYGALVRPVESLAPFFRFEMMRTLLSHAASTPETSPDEITSKLFDHIVAVLSSSSTAFETAWDGHLHNLSDAQLPVALWWLVGTKYMDVFESFASEKQLDEIVRFMVAHASAQDRIKHDHEEVSIPAVTARLLHSADFFELLRTRISISALFDSSCDKGTILASHLDILLSLPTEYLDRILKRKIVSVLAEQKAALTDRKVLHALKKYTTDDAGTGLIKDIRFLARLLSASNDGNAGLVLGLYEQLWALMLQNWTASPERFTSLSALVDSVQPYEKIYLLTWRTLASEATLSTMPEGIRKDLSKRHDGLQQASQQISDTMALIEVQDVLDTCNTAQLVSKWLLSEVHDSAKSEGEEYARLSQQAIGRLLKINSSETPTRLLKSITNAALVLASRNVCEDGVVTFESFVVTTWLLAQKEDLQGVSFTKMLAKASTAQPDKEYENAVHTLTEAVSPDVTAQALAAALHLLGILVAHPPKSATRAASQTFSAVLRKVSLIQTGGSLAALSPVAILGITSYIKAFLEQRIGVPELHDVGTIWSILHDILIADPSSPTCVPCVSTSEMACEIFLNIIGITSILATHRRDHVVPTFAPFARVLCDILQLMRLSGGSHSEQATQGLTQFPRWALADQGRWTNAPRCSKAVARLLLSLGTRTTVLQRSTGRGRAVTSSTTSSNVVSLSGPMSKHAPFIMVNYLTAATDSRFAMSSENRKDISTGILEILATMGKSEREALMKGYLNSEQEAERVLLRLMWKELDSVRYKGE